VTTHQPDSCDAINPTPSRADVAVAEALRDISHRLRGPLGIFMTLEADLANLSPAARALLWGAVDKIRLVVDDCTTTYSQVLPKTGPKAGAA
jgi:hypothetical protein